MHPFVNPRLDQPDVFAILQAERAYQDAKWGSLADHPHEAGAWLLVMKGKLDAAISSWQSTAGTDVPALIHLVKALAVGVACMEQHGGPVVMKAIADMEFTRTNHGYLSPNKRSQCYWPVLEAIRQRMKKEHEERVATGFSTRHSGT
jgi:hypothetical protein